MREGEGEGRILHTCRRLKRRRALRRLLLLASAGALAVAAWRWAWPAGLPWALAATACAGMAALDRRSPTTLDAACWLDGRQGGVSWQTLEGATAGPFAPLVERSARLGDRGGVPMLWSGRVLLVLCGALLLTLWAPRPSGTFPEGPVLSPTPRGEIPLEENGEAAPEASVPPASSEDSTPAASSTVSAGSEIPVDVPVSESPAEPGPGGGDGDAVPERVDGTAVPGAPRRTRLPGGGEGEPGGDEGDQAGSGRFRPEADERPTLDPADAAERARRTSDGDEETGDPTLPLARDRAGIALDPESGFPLRLGPLGATRRTLRPSEERYLLRLHQALLRREEGGTR